MQSLTLRRTNTAVWIKALGVALFAVATALSARISVRLPFSPVPLTLQTLVVLLSGFVLGVEGGVLAQVVYLQAILLGAPMTAAGLAGPAALLSPTGGYLMAFPVAAGVAGYCSRRATLPGVVAHALGGVAGMAAIYAAGAAWLSVYTGSLATAWKLGVAPFVGADLLKMVLASAMLSLKRR